MKRKLPSGVHFQIACFTEGRSFRCCTKNRLILPQFYYFYGDIERTDFDFDIVTNVQVVVWQLKSVNKAVLQHFDVVSTKCKHVVT